MAFWVISGATPATLSMSRNGRDMEGGGLFSRMLNFAAHLHSRHSYRIQFTPSKTSGK